MQIVLNPVEMSPAVMQDLEARGLIIRLCPNNHELEVGDEETRDGTIYSSAAAFGPHKLITVTVNRTTFASFGTHADNEEFLLIGDPATKPLYLVIALHRRQELAAIIECGELSAADFCCLKVRYNDPFASFFVMLKDVPHGEVVAGGDGRPASFYVTEPRDLGIDLTDFGDYELVVG